MKTFENFTTKDEELFLKIAHLDELVIRFDFIYDNESLAYLYEGVCLFIYVKKYNYIDVNKDKIYVPFEDLYFHKDIFSKLKILIDKYFNIKINDIDAYEF
jgi:dolichol kinase